MCRLGFMGYPIAVLGVANSQMTVRIRRLAALAIGLAPSNRLRIALYRCLLRYDISPDAQIGWMTIVLIDHASIGRARIGRRNRFVGPFVLEIRDGARIGSQNDVLCGDWTASPQFQHVGCERYCRLGADTLSRIIT